MKITSVRIAQLTIPLIRPFITAIRRTEHVDDVVVMIQTDTGHIGYGSAAATPAITGDSRESIITTLQTILAPQLIGQEVTAFHQLLQRNANAVPKHTSPKAAIDIALHDLFAQYCQLPLYRWLGATQNTISTCMTISVNTIDDMVNDAVSLVGQGFNPLKIKLGVNPQEDIERIRAIRLAVGDDITLLVDANQGWSVEGTLTVIRGIEQLKLNISLVEQPVIATEISQLKTIHDQVDCRIIADEACFSPQDTLALAKLEACDGINIKLMKSGGIEAAKTIYTIAHTANMEVMVGCMLESPIGVAAMASFALSQPTIRLADLDPIGLIRRNPVLGGAQLRGNTIVLSDRPGLGIEGIAEGLLPLVEVK